MTAADTLDHLFHTNKCWSNVSDHPKTAPHTRALSQSKKTQKPLQNKGFHDVRQRGFEPPTPWSVAKCSIQLSYCRMYNIKMINQCRRPESNRYGYRYPRDFKSRASASSATPAGEALFCGCPGTTPGKPERPEWDSNPRPPP